MEIINGANKKIIGGIGAIIFLLAVLTVLNSDTIGTQKFINKRNTDFSGGSGMANTISMMPNEIPSTRMDTPVRENVVAPMTANESSFESADKKVIKNGDLNLKVDSVDKASGKIAQVAKENGGDIFSSNVFNYNNVKNGTVMVRIPVDNFEKAFTEIKKVATVVVQESTSGQDVTEKFIDLQAQLRNKQAEEQQFTQILGQAQKISDILEVTQQLARVRGEIERIQGQLKYLNSQADMANITINLSEDSNITITDSWRPWQVVKEAVNALIEKSQNFVNFVIVLLITVIPVAILYLLAAYTVYLIGKKIYFKLKKSKQE